jgi:hypothetical protein
MSIEIRVDCGLVVVPGFDVLAKMTVAFAAVIMGHRLVTVGKVSDEEAETFAGNVDDLLMRLKQRLLQTLPGVHVIDFVIHSGSVPKTSNLGRSKR